MKKIFYGRTGKWVRRCILFVLDMVFVFISVQIAIGLRYEGNVTRSMYATIMGLMPEILAVYAACSVIGGVYDLMWRYAGAGEIMRLAVVYIVSMTVTLVLNRVIPWYISRPILVMTAMCMLVLVASTRFMWKLVREFARSRGSGDQTRRILIVGAGEGGVYACLLYTS